MGKDYFQKFTHDFKDKGRMNLTNVIGMIPGTDAQLKDEVVVVSAHYDHPAFILKIMCDILEIVFSHRM